MANPQTKENNLFNDAEHLWFWFISSRRIQSGFTRPGACNRPCELLDIETLVTQMYLSGRITVGELEVLKKYGELRKIPNQHIWKENKDAALWSSAIAALGSACRKKGWIE